MPATAWHGSGQLQRRPMINSFDSARAKLCIAAVPFMWRVARSIAVAGAERMRSMTYVEEYDR